jgi:argininosuccinate lyase
MARGIRIVGAGAKEDDATAPVITSSTRKRPSTKAASKPATRSTAKPPKPAAAGPEKAEGAGRKVWAGRLGAKTARRVEEYTSSLLYDRRLYVDDIDGSIAHARMLKRADLITGADQKALVDGLRDIRRELDKDEFVADPGDEDIHTAVERRLYELCGEVAGKLHTGRSRNDQVATDLRLYSKRQIRELMLAAAGLQEALLRRAQDHRTTLLPGYTHTQRAQIVSLAHHLLAYVEMLQRDIERLEDAHDRCNVMPLGSGALAGTTLPIDRRSVAAELNFDAISANSLDAVGDRDFVIELISVCATLMMHLSRLSEELVLWTTAEFGFADLPDAYATGSSLMPQKKNPDVLELARGRVGRVVGALVSVLTMMKAMPLAYDRDMQEDKEPLFDAVDTSMSTLLILTEIVRGIRFDTVRMRDAANDAQLLATDVAEYLVVKGLPFREAHTTVGAVVRRCVRDHRSLADLDLEEWRAASPLFDEDVLELFDIDSALRRREIAGGPGPRAVSRQLVRAATLISKTRRLVPVLAKAPQAVKEVGVAVRR